MAVLGIVLIVVAVLFGLGVAVSSGASTTMEVFGVDFGVVVATVFFLGAAAGAVLIVGLWLTKKGLSRGYRRHKEVRELRHQVAATPDPATTVQPDDTAPSGKHAADVPVDVPASDEPHTVADGPETRQPH
ncbi:hypothetical protein [Kribbella italica]|uniref:Uncharacterized membrane protein YciS (DUF1049 family) n=1 Tax=Kribbella italica TaxID=1540520 RepID=A0A7W9MXZ0_9ACTN|nr:hypothetical protein [Kribbella italica]MBB5839880.1 uncharacterized membrane protein YciS (DUF1049 family) [Kribbella italica]